MKLVSINEIPTEVKDVDLSDPMAIFKLAREMEVFCIKNKGIGLSAVQVGVPLHFFVAKLSDKFEYFANCRYKSIKETEQTVVEGCLSIPDRFFRVKRHFEIQVTGLVLTQSVSFTKYKKKWSGFSAVIMQHEIDHGYGILISEIGQEVSLW